MSTIPTNPNELKGITWFNSQIENEFPWLDRPLKTALDQLAQGREIVPDDDLDAMMHALCLSSRLFYRVSSLMYEATGNVVLHRPYCSHGDDPDQDGGTKKRTIVYSPELTSDENIEFESYYKTLVP